MTVLTVISPLLKVLLERFGKPEIINRPSLFRIDGAGAVIVCNHIGWFDSLWIAYAAYPRQLRYMSKHELFGSSIGRLVLQHGGCIAINRENPSPSSIKAAVEILRRGELMLIFPSGTTSHESVAFKRGAASVAMRAGVPLVPTLIEGPARVHAGQLLRRPTIKVTFGSLIPTAGLPFGKPTATALTRRLEAEVSKLRSISEQTPIAA